MSQTVAIIPARGGSVRLPGKNIKPFFGKPIIAYSIETARKSGLFDRIFVSTDSREIAVVAGEYNAEVFMRATDDGSKGTQEVARDVLVEMPDVSMACVIYPCSPLLKPSDLERAHSLLMRPGVLYAMSVGTDPMVDAGCFYFGHADAFRAMSPLIDSHTVMVAMPKERVCDVNTIDDWLEAEAKYEALRRTE